MFMALFAMIYIPIILLRVVWMLFRIVGRVLAMLARTAIRNQQRKAMRPAKRKVQPYPKIRGREVFI
jgi:hypothetical protein